MDAALPRVADAAVQLHCLTGDVHGSTADVGLRHRGGHVGVCAVIGDRLHCRIHELAGNGDADGHVGAGMLDGLEGADRPAELLTHLRVADRRGKHCLTEP